MTTELEPSESVVLEKGTKVHLKQTTIGESLGIKAFNRKGGEATVSSSTIDSKGRVVYTVTLFRNGKSRAVYREDLIVHRPTTKSRRKSRECTPSRC